jgi:hypothetical protein
MLGCPNGGFRGPLITLSHLQDSLGRSTFAVFCSSPYFRFEDTPILRVTASEVRHQPVADLLGPRQNSKTA